MTTPTPVHYSFSLARRLADLITRVAKKHCGLDQKVLGFHLEDSAALAARRVLDGIISSAGQVIAAAEAPKENFTVDPKLTNPYAGQVLTFGSGASSLKETKEDEIKRAEIIVSPGLGGGGSEWALHDTMFQMSRVFPGRHLAIYSPVNEGEGRACRYALGMGCYIVPSFINEEESENFFKKVFAPRFFDPSGKPLPPEKCSRIVLGNFSIGGREAESHFRFFANQLLASGVRKRDIPQYFDKIALFNIGCPRPSWGNPEDRPLTATVFSQDDVGCRKLPQFMIDFLLNGRLGSSPAEIIARPGFGGEKDDREMLLLLRHGEIPCGGVRSPGGRFVPNVLGHNLANYVDAIIRLKSPEGGSEAMVNTVGLFDAFADRAASSAIVTDRRRAVFQQAQTHEELPIEHIGEEEVMHYLLHLDAYAQREMKARNEAFDFVRRFFVGRSPQPSACAEELPKMVAVDDIVASALPTNGNGANGPARGGSGVRNFSTTSAAESIPPVEENEIELEIDAAAADSPGTALTSATAKTFKPKITKSAENEGH